MLAANVLDIDRVPALSQQTVAGSRNPVNPASRESTTS